MEVEFKSGRAIFHPLKLEEDKDPITQKFGVAAYYGFIGKIVGYILSLGIFGKAAKIEEKDGHFFYVNINSVRNWSRRHGLSEVNFWSGESVSKAINSVIDIARASELIKIISDHKVYTFRAGIYSSYKNYKQALVDLEEAYKVSNTDPIKCSVLMQKAQALQGLAYACDSDVEKNKNIGLAIDVLNELISIDPNYNRATTMDAKTYRRSLLLRYPDAITKNGTAKEVREKIFLKEEHDKKIEEADSRCNKAIGECRSALRSLKEAVLNTDLSREALRKTIVPFSHPDRFPSDKELDAIEGNPHFKDLKKAIDEFKIKMNESPQYNEVIYNYDAFFEDCKDMLEAFKTFEANTPQEKDNEIIMDLFTHLALYEYRRIQQEESYKDLEKLLEKK